MKTAFPYMDLPMTAVENEEIELFSSVGGAGEVLSFSYACPITNSLKGGIMPVVEDEKKEVIPEEPKIMDKDENFQDGADNFARLEEKLDQIISLLSGKMAEEKDNIEEDKKDKEPSPNSVADSEQYSAVSLIDARVYDLAKMDKIGGINAWDAYSRECFSAAQKKNFYENYQEKLKFQMPHQHRMSQFANVTVPRQKTEDDKIVEKFAGQEKLARAFLKNYRDTLAQRDHFQAADFREQFPENEQGAEKYIKAYLRDARINPGKYNYLLKEGV